MSQPTRPLVLVAISAARRATARRSGRAPPAFRDWLAAQLKNPPDERSRLTLQAAWDEMEAAGWRMPDAWEGEAS